MSPIAPPSQVSTRHGGLPLAVRGRLEAVFGPSLAAIRVHESDLPGRFGTNAVAHGTDLHFAPAAFEPGTQAGLFLLAHELTHTFQQQRLPHARGVRLLVDPVLEAQADRIARLVVADPIAARREVRAAFPAMLSPEAARGSNWVQPNVHVVINGKDSKLTNAGEAMKKIEQGIKDHEVREHFLRLKTRILPVLQEWIAASRRLWKRWIGNQRERTVSYTSWDSIARALLGEVRSASNLKVETDLARATAVSTYVHGRLADYLSKINAAMTEPRFKHVKGELFPRIGSFGKQYKHWFPKGGMKKILEHPDQCEFKHLVAGVHDVGSAFEKGYNADWTKVPDEKCVATILIPNGVRGYDTEKAPMEDENYDLLFRVGNLGSKHCTLIEENEIIRSARDMGMPVGFGPSFTTGRTLQMCESFCDNTGVAQGEKLKLLGACAWGLFAFWNLYYERRFSRAHSFHEAMDMANNYGVPYTPFWYPNQPPTDGEPFPVGDVPG